MSDHNIENSVVLKQQEEQKTPLKAPSKTTNPIVILLGILFLATALTYVVNSGVFERNGRLVIPGSYEVIEKNISVTDLFSISSAENENSAQPVSILGTIEAIPKGLEKSSGLIFMVLIIGGMFGILAKTGVIDAGLERLLSLAKGNLYILVTGLMIIFSAGSTFLGLASEYLLFIPIVVAMVNRLGMSNIVGLAIVTIGTKVGYIASVTNPVPLTIAQPLVGLQIFSGADARFLFYIIFLIVGILFMLFYIRKSGFNQNNEITFDSAPLSARHIILLTVLGCGVGFLVYASNKWQWHHETLSAYYIGLSIVFAAISGLGASNAARAFISGMKKVLMASILIGVATAVSIVLADGKILDTIVEYLTNLIGDSSPKIAVIGMFVSQLLLDFLIPSTSGQAAVSMPILGPIGQLSGVQPQTTVLAFLFGNGLTNMLTPTSGTLLAYLATARVGWGEWARFILPLWFIFMFIAIIILTVTVTM